MILLISSVVIMKVIGEIETNQNQNWHIPH
jgi:hypothetical protein